MALNSSGPISLGGTTTGQSIEIENGGNGTTQISLNDTAVRTLAGVPSGQITMPGNFWGKANAFTFSFNGGTDVNLYNAAISAGWNGTAKVIATNNGVIQSSSTGTPALTIPNSFPNGVDFINNSLVVGRGGNGGNGGSGYGGVGGTGGSAGTGLYVLRTVSVTNNGTISGGGGGGGGGGGRTHPMSGQIGGGGGGGGIGVASGGAAGNGGGAQAGQSSSTSAAGSGGLAGNIQGAAGNGGPGGGYGSSGTAGAVAVPGTAGGPGGGAGPCTVGNANITWVVNGNRYGALN